MPISSRHFNLIKSIPGLNFPVDLEVKDQYDKNLGIATMDAFGRVVAKWENPPKTYDNPSSLRASFDPNGQTYTRFFYRGKSLRAWGVE